MRPSLPACMPCPAREPRGERVRRTGRPRGPRRRPGRRAQLLQRPSAPVAVGVTGHPWPTTSRPETGLVAAVLASRRSARIRVVRSMRVHAPSRRRREPVRARGPARLPEQEQFVSTVSTRCSRPPRSRKAERSRGASSRPDARRLRHDQRRGGRAGLHPAVPVESADRRPIPATRGTAPRRSN